MSKNRATYNVGQTSAQMKFGQVKFIHNVFDGPNVDIYVNNNKILSNIPYKAISPYIATPVGSAIVNVTITGTMTIVATITLMVKDKVCYSAIVHGTVTKLTSIAILALVDSTKCLNGFGQFRFVNAANSVPPVDVYFNGLKTFSNVAYGQVGKSGMMDYVKVNCDKIQVTVKLTQNSTIIYDQKLSFECGQNYSLITSGLVGLQSIGNSVSKATINQALNTIGNSFTNAMNNTSMAVNNFLNNLFGNNKTENVDTYNDMSEKSPFTLLQSNDAQNWCMMV